MSGRGHDAASASGIGRGAVGFSVGVSALRPLARGGASWRKHHIQSITIPQPRTWKNGFKKWKSVLATLKHSHVPPQLQPRPTGGNICLKEKPYEVSGLVEADTAKNPQLQNEMAALNWRLWESRVCSFVFAADPRAKPDV